jgi:uncharacterized protein with ACT and thioredoxin-like domain
MHESTEREVPLALMVQTPDEPGALHALTGVLLDHEANIIHVGTRHVIVLRSGRGSARS